MRSRQAGAKDALNTGGQIAGTAAGEVLEGVATGVEKTWDVTVELDPTLTARGISMGRTSVTSDNQISVYLIAEKAITDTLTAVALEKDGVESGRAQVVVALEAGSSNYFDIQFQERTDLKRKSTVRIK